MEKLKPRAVIFDLGSTLIEYESESWDELSANCLMAGLDFLEKKKIAIPPSETFLQLFADIRARYRERASKTYEEWTVEMVAEELFAQAEIESDEKLVADFFDAYYRRVTELLYLIDGAREVLARLRTNYDAVGLISNTVFPERVHQEELKRFDIAQFFDFTIFSSTFGRRKPHKDIFLKAANLAGQAPSDCVYIGDRYLEDVWGPTQLGMSAVLKVKEGREYPEEMPEATRRIDELTDLFEHVEVR
jgi:putative hydrolase of the HAD superfamily